MKKYNKHAPYKDFVQLIPWRLHLVGLVLFLLIPFWVGESSNYLIVLGDISFYVIFSFVSGEICHRLSLKIGKNPTLAYLVGFIGGAVAGGYVTNEVMEWIVSDAYTKIRYTIDGLAALIAGEKVGKVAYGIGWDMGVKKVRKVLNKKD